ncbi:MAG: hypothetical protein EZS28_019316 [Streblomastix strix]|uniref:Uncharacterized protein n=1 Tax=Streblomastix strix TaxID=222440 RepID=A0A5J4VR47_9EUKA|nr:MAG: hypothetical protein EZS28_019316 [Streblomastix strix]
MESTKNAEDTDDNDKLTQLQIQFNAFDEILFSVLYVFYKLPRFGHLFQSVEVLITIIQCAGVAYRVFDWPLRGIVDKTILDFFGETWRSDDFLLTMTLVLGILQIAVVFGIFVLAVLSKRGFSVIPLFLKVLQLAVILLTGMFYLPSVNVFLGGFLCFTQIQDNPNTLPKISCNGRETVVLVLGLIFILIDISFTFIIRLFDFAHNHKKGGIYTLQTGFYNIFIMILTSLIQIVGLTARGYPLAVSIVGIVIFSFLAVYPCIFQPFFSVWGNVIWGIAMQICFVVFSMGIFTFFLDQSKTYVIIIEWIVFALLVITLPLINALITYKRGISLWGVREDEETPQPVKLLKGEQRVKLLSQIEMQEKDKSWLQTPVAMIKDSDVTIH